MIEDSNIIKLIIDENHYCKVCLFGATLISWINNGEEFIFLSSTAKFDNKTPIRGGIPIIFPCFGPWSNGPQHGFARITKWQLSDKPKLNNESVTAVFMLKENEETLKMWNYKFNLKLIVTLRKQSLTLNLLILNEDSKEFDFTTLFHTYFKTPNINLIKISGLKDCVFVDKLLNKEEVEDRDLVLIDKPVDRVYKSTSNVNLIHNVTGNKSIELKKENLPDTVLWNPWKEKAMQMSDLGKEYEQMVCVESGHVGESIKLSPNCTFSATQILTIV